MNILVTGASGFIGSAVSKTLSFAGHNIIKLKHHESANGEVEWTDSNKRKLEELAPFQAVVHLAGENIASGRWSDEKKQRIMDSRRKGTRSLAEALTRCTLHPEALICASAAGYYGNRPNEVLTEESGPGAGFLAEVCQRWEESCQPAEQAGIRVVKLRFGVVLDKSGGMLARLLPLFRLGLASRLSSGRQYMSWISLADLVSIVEHSLIDQRYSGPINATSPKPVTNREFTDALAAAVHRKARFFVPAPLLRLAFGEVADEMLLNDTRALPQKLNSLGFEFRYRSIEKLFGTLA